MKLGGMQLRKSHTVLFAILLWVTVVVVTLAILLAVRSIEKAGDSEPDDVPLKVPSSAHIEEDTRLSGRIDEVAAIDLQPVIDEWVANMGELASVVIYDLDRDEMVGAYLADELRETASIYKLFVVYEGYRRVQTGEWDGDELVGATGYTILECLDLAIRESNSQCAEAMLAEMGRSELTDIIEQKYGIVDSRPLQLAATANDVFKMLKTYYIHRDITDTKLLDQMWDSFLNQPVTEYDWRQGLPAGFSTDSKVYNKVGWDYNEEEGRWNTYNDAAIVEISTKKVGGDSSTPPVRHLAIVVMTNGVGPQKVRELGEMIEAACYKVN